MSKRSESQRRTSYKRTDHEPVESSVLLLRSIPDGASTDLLLDTLKVFGPCEGVRIAHDRSTGDSRGFAFAEFSTPRQARDTLELTGGRLTVLGSTVTLEVSHSPRSIFPASSGFPSGDWTCSFCRTSNFARRDACFSCHAPRSVAQQSTNDPSSSSSSSAAAAWSVADLDPTQAPVLVVRGLGQLTGEGAVREYYSKIAPVKDVRLARERDSGASRGFCFVEFFCLEDARNALIASNQHRISIDGSPVQVLYARDGPTGSRGRRSQPNSSSSLIQTPSSSSSSSSSSSAATPEDWQVWMAWAAYAAAMAGQSQQQAASSSTAPAATETPQVVTSAATDLEAQLSEFYSEVGISDEQHQRPKESDASDRSAVSRQSLPTISTETKEKLAASSTTDRKLSAEMERWTRRHQELFEAPPGPTKRVQPDVIEAAPQPPRQESAPEPEAPPPTVCWICRRQFPTAEALEKHVRLSKMHKDNLELQQSQEEAQDRNRAAERRALWNQPERPPAAKKQRQEEEPVHVTRVGTETPIPADNVGARMLHSMGWNDGEGLGRSGEGMKAPLRVETHGGHAGIGVETFRPDPSDNYTLAARKEARHRFDRM